MAQPRMQRKLSRRAPGIAGVASPPSPLHTRPFLVEETSLDEKLPRYSAIVTTTAVSSSRSSVVPSERWRKLLRWLTQAQKDNCCPIGCGMTGQIERSISPEKRPLLKQEKIDFESRVFNEKCALPTDLYKGIDLSSAAVSTHRPRRPRPTIIDSVLYTDEYDSSRTGSPEGKPLRRRKSSAGERHSTPKVLDHPDLPLGTTTPPRSPPVTAATPARGSPQLHTKQYDHPDLPIVATKQPEPLMLPPSHAHVVAQLTSSAAPQPPARPLRTLSHSRSQNHLKSQPDTEPDPEVKHVPRRAVSYATPPPSLTRSHSATLVTLQQQQQQQQQPTKTTATASTTTTTTPEPAATQPPVPAIPKIVVVGAIAKSKSVSHGRSRSDSSAATASSPLQQQQQGAPENARNNAFAAAAAAGTPAGGLQRAHTTKVKASAWWVEKNVLVAQVREVKPVQMPVVASGHAKLVVQAKRGSGVSAAGSSRREVSLERPESQVSKGSWLDLDGDDA